MKKLLLIGTLATLNLSVGAQTWPQTATLLRDIAPGRSDGVKRTMLPIPLNGKLVFAGDSLNIAEKLWISDGTTAGTTRVGGPQYRGNFGPYISFLTWNGKAFHTGGPSSNPTGGLVLWRTDISGNGSDSLSAFLPGYNADVLPFYDTTAAWLYFLNQADNSGYAKLMKTDGTSAGTTQVPTVSIYVRGSSIAAIGDDVFYHAISPGFSGLHRTNTVTGVHVALKAGDITLLGRSVGKLYFTVPDLAANKHDLWITDGTISGTLLLKAGFKAVPIAFKSWKGKAYFGGILNATECNLWASDGTPTGTSEIFTLPPAARRAGTNGPVSGTELVDMGSYMMFVGQDTAGNEPWRTDGTATGTYRIKDLRPAATGGNSGSVFEDHFKQKNVIDGRLYFRAYSDTARFQLHVSDGTAAGTVRATYLKPNGQNAVAGEDGTAVKYNNRIYFIGETDTEGQEIFSFFAPAPVPQGVSSVPALHGTITVYPNPAKVLLTVVGGQTGDQVVVQDLTGRTWKHQSWTPSGLEIEALPTGAYLISLFRNGLLFGTAKFVKE